jgi:hypothetical protein
MWKINSLILVLTIAISSCTKVEKQAPNNFIKKDNWSVTKLTIGHDDINSLPTWNLETETDGMAIWHHSGNSNATFFWSFSKNFNTFSFYVDADPANKINQAYKQCQNLSGTYSVLTNKKGLFEFESYDTYGYKGPRVYIKIE